ncbi:molybdopterin adenylyltransferase, partial [Aquitalea magnusonii]|uniref:molybdopterin adenylyltransferase n=1 Tax=Aquitalea magnusonii TaxID=332411 RepID=UPI0009EA27B2
MLKIGLVSVSDRASSGVYQDQGIPALQDWLTQALASPFTTVTRLIPDEQAEIESTLRQLVDEEGCHLVLTTGGTGPAPRDVTPDATLAVADREMPGFGEQMRQISLRFVPTAILSRQVGVIRKSTLILNLPGQPKAIKETLEGLKDQQGETQVPGIFAAVPYCLDLIGGPYVETVPQIVKAFRPQVGTKTRFGLMSYRAPAWLPDGHSQTIWPALLLRTPRPPYRRERWPTPDGASIALDFVDGQPDSPLVVLFHGLEGSSDSHYARALMQAVAARGWHGVVPHFRGCGGMDNPLPRAYHAGDAAEIRWILQRLARRHPLMAVAAVSLGGSMLLNYLAEEGPSALPRAAAAISAPLDLVAA